MRSCDRLETEYGRLYGNLEYGRLYGNLTVLPAFGGMNFAYFCQRSEVLRAGFVLSAVF